MKLDLAQDFDKFVKTNDAPPRRTIEVKNVRLFLHKNKTYITTALEFIDALANFNVNRSVFTLGKGVMRGILELNGGQHTDAGDFLKPENGWHPLQSKDFQLFMDEIKQLPYDNLKFSYGAHNLGVRVMKILDCEFCVVFERYGPGDNFFSSKEDSQERILKYLAAMKMKNLNTDFISFAAIKTERANIVKSLILPEEFNTVQSNKEREVRENICQYLNKGINRSIILHGPPGTGKTTLSQTLIYNLGFRTLKIKCRNQRSDTLINTVMTIIDLFDIEAVILDDFEYSAVSEDMLELLETMNKKVKLTIGIVNNMDVLAPALIRPKRFDEIIEINALEEQTVRAVLGELYSEYGEKVRDWPIAYINELVIRHSVLSDEKFVGAFAELSQRAEKQLEEFKKKPAADDTITSLLGTKAELVVKV